MKKTIALVMALVMTAALLVGCGGQETLETRNLRPRTPIR